jgi:hypothetical protein
VPWLSELLMTAGTAPAVGREAAQALGKIRTGGPYSARPGVVRGMEAVDRLELGDASIAARLVR